MSQIVTLNGVQYTIPDPGDSGWGSAVTQFLVALVPGVITRGGGTQALLADLDLGGTRGVKLTSLISRSTNPAQSNFVRLGSSDSICWRNIANTGDVGLGLSSLDQIMWQGVPLLTAPAVMLYQQAAATTLPASSVQAQLSFGTMEYDSTASGTSWITNPTTTWTANIPVSKGGNYQVSAGFTCSPASGTLVSLIIKVNGVARRTFTQTAGANPVTISGTTVLNIPGAAVVTVWGSQSSGSSVNTAGAGTGMAQIHQVQG